MAYDTCLLWSLIIPYLVCHLGFIFAFLYLGISEIAILQFSGIVAAAAAVAVVVVVAAAAAVVVL